MVSDYVIKEAKKLSIKDVLEGKRFWFINFNESESEVKIDKQTGDLTCNCYFKSNHDKENKKLCKHQVRLFINIIEKNGSN